MAILAHKPLFWVFTTFNMIAMYSSAIACGLLLMALIFDHKLATHVTILAMGCLVLTFLTVPVAFMAAVRLVVANNSALALILTIIGAMYTSHILLANHVIEEINEETSMESTKSQWVIQDNNEDTLDLTNYDANLRLGSHTNIVNSKTDKENVE
ncbi:Ankyrin repeat-containing protein [Spatholobus suberectus]|nr:Ankyrin repeat-containing protein [Spatholobus suberectus]